MRRDALYFMLKAHFFLELFSFFSRLFFLTCLEKGLDKRDTVNFKIYNVTDWITNIYNTHTAQITTHILSKAQKVREVRQCNKI